MTRDVSIFHKYKPCSDNLTIRITNGSLSKVASTSSVVISKNLTLDSVLLIPNLDCNLLSISKLTNEKNCAINFFLDHCEFQDLDSGKTIGSAEVCLGLFSRSTIILEDNLRRQFVKKILSVSSSNNDSVIMLWYYRLGHPSFKYLKHLFPSLFNKNSKEFQCEVCQLSKHVRSSYPLQPYKLSHPFSMIHSDIWGLSRIKNVTDSR